MGRARTNRIVAGAGLVAVVVGAGCSRTIPPYPSARLAVDTDLPVPRVVERLRVDIFDDTGRWIESRDYPRVKPEDFPATFGIFSTDESRARDVTVRLRAYPEGGVRDYRGHRPAPPPYVPTKVAESLEELCRNVPDLPPAETITLRRGATRITSDHCVGSYNEAGSVAARVTIAAAGKYRFAVVAQAPVQTFGGIDTTLFLRRTCTDESAANELGCNDDSRIDGRKDFLSDLTLDLGPGTYTLMTAGGFENQPGDVTLQWDEASKFVPIPVSAPAPYVEPGTDGPRLVVDGRDVTPREEPAPGASVDRLVRVRLEPGSETRVRFTLRAACAGTEPRLVFDASQRLVASASTTCVDTAGELAPIAADVAPERFDAPAIGAASTEEPCPPGASDDQVVCVPGGFFVMGDRALDATTALVPLGGSPLRIVQLSRFFMDRREVTVGRYRQARAEGLPRGEFTDINDVVHNEKNRIYEGAFDNLGRHPAATYSATPLGRETYPLEFVSWAHARSVCELYEGDLPTEAQWEYAATSAGRTARSRFPWGEETPTCDRVHAYRTDSLPTKCDGIGPVGVEEIGPRGDVTPLGIEGLGGNVGEHTRDSAASYDAPCWRGSPLKNPFCNDPTAPYRVTRGASWMWPFGFARASFRSIASTWWAVASTGFRCVYTKPPTRRWSGP